MALRASCVLNSNRDCHRLYNRSVPQKPVPQHHDYFLWPEPRGYFRWPRRRRILLEIGIGVLIIAAIAIGAANNLPTWLEALGWAAWIVWMILLCTLGLRDWNIRRKIRQERFHHSTSVDQSWIDAEG